MIGGVTLAGDLQGSFLNGFIPAHNDRFFIIINDGVDAVSGTFVGFTQGSTLSFGGRDFMVGYTGDSAGGSFTGGNDVVLQAIPEPGAGTLLLGSLGMALGLQRRRRRSHTK